MQIIVRRENAITCYSETSHNRLVFPVHSCINKYAHCTQSIHWMSIYSKESWSRQRFWTGPITLIGIFLVSHFNFLFLFVPCGGLSWLPISFSLHVKYTLSYRIVSMSHIVESCPLTKLDGGLSRLHSADEDAVSWLTNYGKWHAYEKKNSLYVLC